MGSTKFRRSSPLGFDVLQSAGPDLLVNICTLENDGRVVYLKAQSGALFFQRVAYGVASLGSFHVTKVKGVDFSLKLCENI